MPGDGGAPGSEEPEVAPRGTLVFQVEPPEWLHCPICMHVIKEPRQVVGGCSHVFCAPCLTEQLRRRVPNVPRPPHVPRQRR
mmetsp:Transcript_43236/g.138076  ORF Transcript_43236/g.138076 Transcript_43236/m.138076 type:complete len:82 (+) Transcript_43236:134-379(+)